MIEGGARLLALADNRNGFRFADRRVGELDRRSFGDAQASAIADASTAASRASTQGSRASPSRERGRGHGPGVRRAQGAGQAARRLGRADGAERRSRLPAFARDVAGQRLQA